MLVLARLGMIALTVLFVIWIVAEWVHRANTARVIGYESGVGPTHDYGFRSMGWKLHLGLWLGIPSLVILWGLVI